MAIFITEEPNHSPNNHRTFTVNFFGTEITTTVTSTPAVVREWIHTTIQLNRSHLSGLVVGIGVQWLPHSISGEDSPASTLQLCVGDRCLVFQLEHADAVPRRLRRFLLHPRNTFVGIWNNMDARKLSESEHQLEVKELIDLRYYVEARNGGSLVRASFETIVRHCLGFDGVRLEKSISMSDWDDYWLSRAQVMQACVDAYVSYAIGELIDAWEISNNDDDY